MLKPICVPCQRFFRPKKSGLYFIEGMPRGGPGDHKPGRAEPDRWKPYKLWSGDLWECPECGAQIISGTGSVPVAEHYQPEFEDLRERLGATFQVNDC